MDIITPRDTITITIDNTKNPPNISCGCSRVLPTLYVVWILNKIAETFCEQGMAQATVAAPVNPFENPGKIPGKSNNGTT